MVILKKRDQKKKNKTLRITGPNSYNKQNIINRMEARTITDDTTVSHLAPKLSKKRGKKLEKWEDYLENSNQKIDDNRKKLDEAKSTNLPVKERQRLRNIISAQ